MSRKSAGFDHPDPERCAWTLRCVDFVRSIGVPVSLVRNVDGFLPAIRIETGGLLVDVDRCYPGDVFHEAGHLATIPAQFRALATGELSVVQQAMDEWLQAHPDGLLSDPEDAVCRQILQCGEAEATAWQYAAAHAVGLPQAWLFSPGAYDGEDDMVLFGLRTNSYLGINGLQAARWTVARRSSTIDGPVYPEMCQWLAA